MLAAAAILYALHGLIAAVDGVYFHLHKYKLYAHPESVVEHAAHTARAGLMAVGAFVFFVVNSGGWLLRGAVIFIALDLAVETWDVLIERRSRAKMGGLSSIEYLAHAHAILLYAAAYTLVLAAKPAGAFAADAPLVLDPYPAWITYIGWFIGVSSVLSTVQHLNYLRPSYRVAPAAGD